MFNQDLNRYSNDYRRQEHDEYLEDNPLGSLDIEVRKIAARLARAADDSKINIEFEDDFNLLNNIWGRLQCLAKPYFREVVIVSAILIFKTGLFMAYRAAKRQGLEIINL